MKTKITMFFALFLTISLCTAPGVLAESELESSHSESEDVLTDEVIETIDELETVNYSRNTRSSIGFASNFSELESLLANPSYTIIALLNDIQMDYALSIDHNVVMLAMSPITITSNTDCRHFIITEDITVEMTNITLDGGGAGGGISSEGGIKNIQLIGLAIQNCTADYGGGILVNSDYATIKETSIVNCSAEISGGGIYIADYAAGYGAYTITETNIEHCTTYNFGGGIFVNDGTLTLTETSIANCTADSRGGGIFIDSGQANINETSIVNCSAVKSGGGIFSYGSSVLTEVSIEGCNAIEGGGVSSYVNLVFESGTISNNSAEYSGGGIWIDKLENLYVYKEAVFSGNTASTGYYMTNEDDIALHMKLIETTSFSEPFIQYAYNNYDIAYTEGIEINELPTVNFYLSPNDTNPYNSITLFPGDKVGTLPRAVKDGCIFIGWVDENYNFVTEETVINQNSNFYAIWIVL